MKGSKCLLLLAAFLVGLGLSAPTEAQTTVFSVEVTSPDSGALKGIDSTFVITARVVDINPADSMEVVMYLVAGNDSTVIGDTLNQHVTFGSLSQSAAIRIGIDGMNDGTATGGARTLKDAETGNTVISMVAAQQKRKRDSANSGANSLANADVALGDADSIVVTTSGNDTTLFTWYGKVHGSSGTYTTAARQVHAAAFVIAGTNNADTSAVVLSTASNTGARKNVKFGIDADRPTDPSELLNRTGGVRDNLGSGAGDPSFATSALTSAAQDVTFNTTTRQVLGIADTLVVRAKLGANANPVLLADSLSVVLEVFNKNFTFDKGVRSVDTLKSTITLTEGMFGDLNTAHTGAVTDTLGVFVVDKAGNRSGRGNAAIGGAAANATTTGTYLDGAAAGLTAGVTFLFDTKKPVLDGQVVAGDTLLPVSNDTISDGSINSFVNDVNPLTYELGEALDSLYITFSGASALELRVGNNGITGNSTRNTTNFALTADARRFVDFTEYGNIGTTSRNFQVTDGTTTDAAQTVTKASQMGGADTLLATGVHTVAFKGKDLAGNWGDTVTRTNVYLDVDDITLVRLFPTKAAFGSATVARLDTIEEETSKVVFKLSEPADSVLITYRGILGPDNGNSRTRKLSGTELTNTASEQLIPVDGLVNGSKYELKVLARDLAGNFTQSAVDTFQYDTSFVVPVIKRFTIAASNKGLLAASHVIAGTEVTLTVKADATTDGTRDAVTYKSAAILKVAGGRGVTLTGTGVTDLGGGRATLNNTDWVVGQRTVTLKDTAGIDTLTVSIVDSTTAGGPFTGALDSSIVYDPAGFHHIMMTVPDTVDAGAEFWVGVTLNDQYHNVRVLDNRYVAISANKLGVMTPTGDQLIKKGSGGFWAKASAATTDLMFTIKDAIPTASTAQVGTGDNGPNAVQGQSKAIVVRAPAVAAPAPLDGPNTVVAEDYMGADGLGDQGGFVMMTWDLSTDHGTVESYRIYREIQVTQRLATAADSTTAAVVALATPEAAMVPWAKVDAVPGQTIGRAIVATLDNVATKWAVAAERGNESAGAKAVNAGAMDAYAMMAQTMQQSKQLAAQVDQPVFAALTPEALSFAQQGIAPRLKSVDDGVVLSPLTETADAVRAIDNIAPAAVPYLRALDTPGDAGSSITLTWTKSGDDRMLPRSASNAVSLGSVSDMVAGVKGYNVYRKVGATGELTLIGKAASGETSFVDQTAFNGVRYTYSVAPYDEDNVTESDVERTAMAIRNAVVDKNGKAVYGLFGADAQVGFDDFFIFADNFGLTAADEAFEPAFDLATGAGVPKVDFDDFFVFADNFGRGIEAAGKVVPMLAGLNADARLYLETAADLPRVGEEVVIDVDLADYVELKGYGLSVVYDAEKLEYVRTVTANALLGEGELATPRAITQTEGQIDIAAYGETVTEGALGMSVVFRTKTEIENSFVEVTDSQVRDGNFAVNAVALPAPVQIQTRPEAFALANNYPNPFNPATTIKYALPEASQVRLEVFNVVGQVVRTLVDNHQNAGRYVVQWDASNDQGHSLSSGIYFYRLQAGGEFLEVKKMLLLK